LHRFPASRRAGLSDSLTFSLYAKMLDSQPVLVRGVWNLIMRAWRRGATPLAQRISARNGGRSSRLPRAHLQSSNYRVLANQSFLRIKVSSDQSVLAASMGPLFRGSLSPHTIFALGPLFESGIGNIEVRISYRPPSCPRFRFSDIELATVSLRPIKSTSTISALSPLQGAGRRA
jgi:hypothetical protein